MTDDFITLAQTGSTTTVDMEEDMEVVETLSESGSDDTSSSSEGNVSSSEEPEMAPAATRKKAQKTKKLPATPMRASSMAEVTMAHAKLVEFAASGKAIAKLAMMARNGFLLYVEEKETMVRISQRTKYIFTNSTEGTKYWVNKKLVPNGRMKMRPNFRVDSARLSDMFLEQLKMLDTATVFVFAEMNDGSPVTSEAVLNPKHRCFFHLYFNFYNHSIRLKKEPDNQKSLKYEYGLKPVFPLNAMSFLHIDPKTDNVMEQSRTHSKYMDLCVRTGKRFTTYFLYTVGAPKPTDKCFFKRVGNVLHVTTEKAPGLLLHNIAVSKRIVKAMIVRCNGKRRDVDSLENFFKLEEMEDKRNMKVKKRALVAEEKSGEEADCHDQEYERKQDDHEDTDQFAYDYDDDDTPLFERRSTVSKTDFLTEIARDEESGDIKNQLFAPLKVCDPSDSKDGADDDEDDEEDNLPAILPDERKRKMICLEDSAPKEIKTFREQKSRHTKEFYDMKYRQNFKQSRDLSDNINN